MHLNKYGVLIIGYNRPQGLQRLLNSIAVADFCADQVDLLVSIDRSGNDDVEQVAQKFVWPHGEKKVFTYPERMGLRKHILHCGTYLKDYDALAVFEDDLYVSPFFYHFMKATVEKYQDCDEIAGISLYNHLWNPNPAVNLPFEATHGEGDVYFMQYAQSWGQIWMRAQWDSFMTWYRNNSGDFLPEDNFPDYVTGWQNSWLKYHIKYCVETNKYFVYPYQSYTTCFTDMGEHNMFGGSVYQVPLVGAMQEFYRLPDLNSECSIRYDVFFERQGMENVLGIPEGELTMDLYGSKKTLAGKTRYLLSTRKYSYSVVKEFGLQMRPHEQNIVHSIEGSGIHLYDTSKNQTAREKAISSAANYVYYHRIQGNTKLLWKVLIIKIKEYAGIKITQMKKKLKL